MALRPLNSIAGFSTGDPAIQIVQANGDITTINFTANGFSNLGPVSNVIITGGSDGQALITDGAGNLTFGTVNTESNRAAPMPYLIPNGESYIVNENFQGLYSQAITIDGELTVDGLLIEIVDTVASQDTQVLFDNNGIPTGNTGFTFLAYNGNLNLPGNVNVNGSIIPEQDDTFDLGSANLRWGNGYFGGNTIYLDQASISVNEQGFLVFTNEVGGSFTVEGTTPSDTSEIENGTSNVKVYANSNIAFTVAGSSNVLIVSTNGANLTTGTYVGNAAGLTNIPGANIVGNISGNISNAAHAVTSNTVVDSTQSNITSVGTLTTLAVSGTANLTDLNVSGNAVISGNLSVNGNLIYVNVTELAIKDPIINLQTGTNAAPLISNSGKDVGTALNYYDTQARVAFMGWDTSNVEFAFGSQTTISSEVVTFDTLGNVRAQTFKGNVEASTIAGNLTTATQSNITTVGTLGSLNVTANIDAGNINGGNVVKGNYLVSNSGCVSINGAMIAFDSGTNAAGIFSTLVSNINFGLSANIIMGNSAGNVTVQGNLIADGGISTTGNISANLITGTLTTASQSNITTVGTLGNLAVSSNTVTNIIDANTTQTQSIVSKRSNVSVSVLTVIDSFAANSYRTAKYVVSSQNDEAYESLEVLLIHNDINSFITVYGAINDGGGNTVTMSTGINNGNVELRATGLAGNTVVKLIGTYVPD
jgi:hypothetical protein